jgi:hypothetical protein
MNCDCIYWCSEDQAWVDLTGHHENCPKRGNVLAHTKTLLTELVRGMEAWGADDDGIHPDAWEAYKRAKAVIGEYDLKEEPR